MSIFRVLRCRTVSFPHHLRVVLNNNRNKGVYSSVKCLWSRFLTVSLHGIRVRSHRATATTIFFFVGDANRHEWVGYPIRYNIATSILTKSLVQPFVNALIGNHATLPLHQKKNAIEVSLNSFDSIQLLELI